MIALNNFEKQYISARRKENRLYGDDQVKWLPEIEPAHTHHKEWQIRKNSSNLFLQYLLNKHSQLDILEVGCGNGWLSAQLARIPGSNVAGIDINNAELEQARRVFDHLENLEFFNCSIDDESIAGESFDIIVFAASIQYFPSFREIIGTALSVLRAGGEIHILDSPFYRTSELETSRKRSEDYYRSIECPEMATYYFHHSIDELKTYPHKIIYKPDLLVNRLKKNKNPFPWICIYKRA